MGDSMLPNLFCSHNFVYLVCNTHYSNLAQLPLRTFHFIELHPCVNSSLTMVYDLVAYIATITVNIYSMGKPIALGVVQTQVFFLSLVNGPPTVAST
jgi:hypothetical protein